MCINILTDNKHASIMLRDLKRFPNIKINSFKQCLWVNDDIIVID